MQKKPNPEKADLEASQCLGEAHNNILIKAPWREDVVIQRQSHYVNTENSQERKRNPKP